MLMHLFQNALKNVNHVLKRSDSFCTEIQNCIYGFEYENDYLNDWNSLLKKYEFHQNKWMQDFFKKER